MQYKKKSEVKKTYETNRDLARTIHLFELDGLEEKAKDIYNKVKEKLGEEVLGIEIYYVPSVHYRKWSKGKADSIAIRVIGGKVTFTDIARTDATSYGRAEYDIVIVTKRDIMRSIRHEFNVAKWGHKYAYSQRVN